MTRRWAKPPAVAPIPCKLCGAPSIAESGCFIYCDGRPPEAWFSKVTPVEVEVAERTPTPSAQLTLTGLT